MSASRTDRARIAVPKPDDRKTLYSLSISIDSIRGNCLEEATLVPVGASGEGVFLFNGFLRTFF